MCIIVAGAIFRVVSRNFCTGCWNAYLNHPSGQLEAWAPRALRNFNESWTPRPGILTGSCSRLPPHVILPLNMNYYSSRYFFLRTNSLFLYCFELIIIQVLHKPAIFEPFATANEIMIKCKLSLNINVIIFFHLFQLFNCHLQHLTSLRK